MFRGPTPIGPLNELLWKGVAIEKRSRRTAKLGSGHGGCSISPEDRSRTLSLGDYVSVATLPVNHEFGDRATPEAGC